MLDPKVAYFFKKFYRNVIKWWHVIYNPIARIISFSEEDEKYTKQLAEEKKKKEEERVRKIALASGQPLPEDDKNMSHTSISDTNFNATTGAFSGLYGQAPVDESTKSVLDEIMGLTNKQNNIEQLIQQQTGQASTSETVPLSPEHEEIVQEANEIYERLLREAQEDELKKQAEIEAAKASQAE